MAERVLSWSGICSEEIALAAVGRWVGLVRLELGDEFGGFQIPKVGAMRK